MKTLYESIFDIDDNIKDDSAIRLSSKWEPITFRSNYGPKEVFDIIGYFDAKSSQYATISSTVYIISDFQK